MHLSGVSGWLCICTSSNVLKVILVEEGSIEVVECSCAHLRIFKSFGFKKTCFEDVECKLCTFESIKVI
jgi:hypothetical protein